MPEMPCSLPLSTHRQPRCTPAAALEAARNKICNQVCGRRYIVCCVCFANSDHRYALRGWYARPPDLGRPCPLSAKILSARLPLTFAAADSQKWAIGTPTIPDHTPPNWLNAETCTLYVIRM